MTGPRLRSPRSPDDLFQAEGIEERSVQVGEQTIGRGLKVDPPDHRPAPRRVRVRTAG